MGATYLIVELLRIDSRSYTQCSNAVRATYAIGNRLKSLDQWTSAGARNTASMQNVSPLPIHCFDTRSVLRGRRGCIAGCSRRHRRREWRRTRPRCQWWRCTLSPGCHSRGQRVLTRAGRSETRCRHSRRERPGGLHVSVGSTHPRVLHGHGCHVPHCCIVADPYGCHVPHCCIVADRLEILPAMQQCGTWHLCYEDIIKGGYSEMASDPDGLSLGLVQHKTVD